MVGGVLGGSECGLVKPCCACHGPHSNPVISRNWADEVETKMGAAEGCQSRAVGLMGLE